MANLHPWPRTENTIDFMQHIRASASDIWVALTSKSVIEKRTSATDVDLPLTVGEPFSFVWEESGLSSGATQNGYSGTIAAAHVNRLLALEWVLPFSKEITYFSIQIQPSFAMFGQDLGAECDIWLIHSGFPVDGPGLFEFDGHSRHWRQSFLDMAADLEGRQGKPTPYALAGLVFVGGAHGRGLLVADVVEDSPAFVAGIKPGDLIRSVDGHLLHSLDDFHDWIDERLPGETGTFVLADREVSVTVEGVEQARQRLLVRQGEEWVSLR